MRRSKVTSIRRTLPTAVTLVASALLASGCGSPQEPSATCVVSKVTDGDTLRCFDGRRMRLLLIDAPEIAQTPYGDEARVQLQSLAGPLDTLTVEYDIDRKDDFGRDLTYLYRADGTMLNETMVAMGYAIVLFFQPNTRHLDRVQSAMDVAQAEGRGLWATWGFACLPRDFRAGRC